MDDDEPIRDTICMVLEDIGFVYQQAANGEDALRILRTSADRFVVLLDLLMPHMTGKDVLDAVEADRSLIGQHAFILMTAEGKTLPLAMVQTLQRMDVPVIAKPFDIDRLVAAVMRAVDRLVGDRGTDPVGRVRR
ncbi:MAG: response regulator [Ktedonobacterales bacterium]